MLSRHRRFVETLPLVTVLACIPLTALALYVGGAVAVAIVIGGGVLIGLVIGANT